MMANPRLSARLKRLEVHSSAAAVPERKSVWSPEEQHILRHDPQAYALLSEYSRLWEAAQAGAPGARTVEEVLEATSTPDLRTLRDARARLDERVEAVKAGPA
jgi:hypothetical protein